jgi:hypothetical protein
MHNTQADHPAKGPDVDNILRLELNVEQARCRVKICQLRLALDVAEGLVLGNQDTEDIRELIPALGEGLCDDLANLDIRRRSL